MGGKDANHQKYDERLSIELYEIHRNSPCLIAMPHTRGKRGPYWSKFLDETGIQIQKKRWYGSAFVSRADEAAWTVEYRYILGQLWAWKSVSLVAPEKIELKDANSVRTTISPKRNAYKSIDWLEREACLVPCGIVILSCGPTATVLADRLARKGIWAVDLGNFGKFL
jgi:hypothetical protein